MTRPRGRRSNASVVANPVLVGAVTTLVIVVAVFLAYNANNGLPFVPTRQLDVLVSNGANLVKGNEVRSGGFRVGVVTDMQPVMLPNRKVGARLTLKLDKKLGGVPVDSKVVIRPRSALGLKYVELDTGRSTKVFADGATMPAAQASVPVDLDEVYNMFDAPTRRASQGNLQGFGDALAGRGADLNQTIQVAPQLFGHLGSVMANLSAPRTELPSFFKELGDAARIVAPVSKTNAHLFTTMANTFDAISRDPQALKSTISESPPTLRAGTESLQVQRPFLEHTAALSRDLDTATTELRAALPTVNSALRVGTPVQRRSVTLNDNLQGALGALEDLVKAPTTLGSLRGLTATVGTLQPQLRYLGPYVTVCNSWNIFWTFAAEHLSAPDDTGSSQRALLNMATQAPGTDGIGSSGANEFAHGKGALPGKADQYVHNNVYAPAIDEKGNADCGAGQTGYIQAYNPLRDKSVKGDPYQGAVTERFPITGRLGPTYAQFDKDGKGHGLNPDHVPAGETFTGPARRRTAPTSRGRSHEAQAAQGPASVRRRRAHARPAGGRDLLRLHQGDPVQAPLHGAGRLPVGQRRAQRLAGPRGRRQRRQGHRDQPRRRRQAGRARDHADRQEGPAAAQGRDDEDPSPHLPGGQLLRRRQPGSPSAPQLHDGDRIPINQTSAPVQLDQVLGALQAPTRKDLQALLRELSSGLKGKGARGYNASIPYWKPAYRDSAIVADAAQGTQPGDLGRYIDRAGATAEAIDRDREQLKSLVTDFDTTAAAFAAREQELSAAVGELPRTLDAAMPALGSLNRSFPAVRGLIRAARPAVRSSGPAIDASMPFVRQARGLVSKPELRGLSHDLRPLVPALTTLTQRSVPLYSQLSQASSCQNDVILPWTKDKIDDKTFPARGPVYEEATKPLPGLAGESRSGDANGQWFRVMLTTPKFAYPMGTDKFFLTGQPLQGVNPPTPKNHARPPLRADVPCETQQPPDLRTVPDAAPQGFDLAQPSAAAKAQALQKTVDWLRKDLKAEGSSLKVSDVPATVKEPTK